MQLYDSQPTIYSANESLNAITSVIVYIFANGSKIVLFFYRELKRYGLFTTEFFGLFVYCVNLCHVS